MKNVLERDMEVHGRGQFIGVELYLLVPVPVLSDEVGGFECGRESDEEESRLLCVSRRSSSMKANSLIESLGFGPRC